MLLQVLQNQTSLLSKLSDQIQSNQVPSAITGIEQSLALAEFGLNLTRPRSIVLCGHPNVGKSSLINALAGFQPAIVNPQAGTTRDVLSQSTAIDGWPVDLKDTAGLRISQDQVEAMGIEKQNKKSPDPKYDASSAAAKIFAVINPTSIKHWQQTKSC